MHNDTFKLIFLQHSSKRRCRITAKYASKDIIFVIIMFGVSCVVAGAMWIAFEESPSSAGQDAG